MRIRALTRQEGTLEMSTEQPVGWIGGTLRWAS